MNIADVDKLTRELSLIYHNNMVFHLRDNLGGYPFRIRTQVFISIDGFPHTVEVQSEINLDTDNMVILEESYKESARQLALREANDIIKNGNNSFNIDMET